MTNANSAEPLVPLRASLRPGSRHIVAWMIRLGNTPVTPERLARLLYPSREAVSDPVVQRSVRRHMRQLRADLQSIDPLEESPWLIRDREGYLLNLLNPSVVALIAEIERCMNGQIPWAEFIAGS